MPKWRNWRHQKQLSDNIDAFKSASKTLTRSRSHSPLTGTEKKAIFGLASVYGFRMLGLFLILPVFAIFAENLEGATPLLIGLAVGIYGLTQALLQIPFGLLSDRIGRKPVILGGLLLFAIGSIIAAIAEDIWLIMIGRAIQGSGAIAAAVMAMVADLTRDSKRTRAMATVGMTIGASFAISLMAGPGLYQNLGMSGIFWLTGAFAFIGILIVAFIVPSPTKQEIHRDAQTVPQTLTRVLQDGQLLRLDFGIFSLHLVLTAVFLSVPLLLRDLGLPLNEHSLLYLAVLIVSVILMVPLIIQAEKYGRMKAVFLIGIGLVILALASMFFIAKSWIMAAVLLGVFFWGFNLLESLLPSLISKTAPVDAKGTAMGAYSTSQFMGGFLGGVLGGLVHQYFGYEFVFIACMLVAIIWFLIAMGMAQPGQFSSRVMNLEGMSQDKIEDIKKRLQTMQGIVEAVVIPSEKVAYLKVDRKQFDEEELTALVAGAV